MSDEALVKIRHDMGLYNLEKIAEGLTSMKLRIAESRAFIRSGEISDTTSARLTMAYRELSALTDSIYRTERMVRDELKAKTLP